MLPTARKAVLAIAALCILAWLPVISRADVEVVSRPADLMQLSLEDLLNVEVTSVSKRAEKLTDSSAAVYVITQDDIRRSGMNRIPELLRMVPGLQVARVDSSKWAVSSRGWSGLYANKLLVMIDGRSVYTPTFSGVFWDVQDMMLRDIDRIEVIRGPGATMWGANAVNGVINVVTKSAADTQGGFAGLSVSGSEESPLNQIQYGGTLPGGDFRVYAKSFRNPCSVDAAGAPAFDAWNQDRAGFRADWQQSEDSQMTLQGDVYRASSQETVLMPSYTYPYSELVNSTCKENGANVLFRMERTPASGPRSTLQAYFDSAKRNEMPSYAESRNTVDVDYQQQLTGNSRHNVVWGVGFRSAWDHLTNSDTVVVSPARQSQRLLRTFFQDDIALRDGRSHLTLGTKIEHNSYTGIEVQPNIRFMTQPSEGQTIWAAVSRAVRTPSRAETTVVTNVQPGTPGPGGIGIIPKLTGNPDSKSEELVSYELGYRVRPTDRLYVDIATFYNCYRRLDNPIPGNPTMEFSPAPHLAVPVTLTNDATGTARGAELALTYEASPRWRLYGSYSWIKAYSVLRDPGDVYTRYNQYATPEHQFGLRSAFDVSKDMEFNTMLWFVDSAGPLSSLPSSTSVPAYTRLDANLIWRMRGQSELVMGVRNALDAHHLEGSSTRGEIPSEVERSFYVTFGRSF